MSTHIKNEIKTIPELQQFIELVKKLSAEDSQLLLIDELLYGNCFAADDPPRRIDPLTLTIFTPEITDENVSDIVTTALEGGSNYWCHKITVVDDDWKGVEYASDVVARGGRLQLYDGESKQALILDKEGVLAAIPKVYKMAMGRLPRRCNVITLKEWLEGQYDASDADQIIQLALFGTTVYG